MKHNNFTKRSILALALLAVSSLACAQAPIIFGIGTDNPTGTLHVHSWQTDEPLEPIVPFPDGWRGGDDSTGTRDGVIPPGEEYHYRTVLHMTNSATGTSLSDGFTLTLYDEEMTLAQREQADMRFETPGGAMVLNAQGNLGLGSAYSGYRLNVVGKARFTGNVYAAQSLTTGTSLTVGTTLSVGTTLTVGTDASVYGGLAVGSGFECDAQGNLKVKRLRVTLQDWPDYVFGEGYRLPSLGEVERYVREHSHLPGVPSAAEVEADGADLGEMNKVLLEKVEELTLYIIDLQKQINELKSNQ